MAETTGISENSYGRRVAQFAIVIFVFPILILVFHTLLIIPMLILAPLLVHFGGSATLWGKVLSVVALLFAGWGAAWICRMIWPRK